MVKNYRLILLFLFVCFAASPATACRYNVRETGFVDLGLETYHLFAYVDNSTSSEQISALEVTAGDLLDGSNIQFEIVNIDKQKDHEAMQFCKSSGDISFPSSVLVSPDGQTLEIPLTKSDTSFKESLTKALEFIISSAKRREILKECAEKYGVVLLIEGPDAKANSQAHMQVLDAIEAVESQMEFLPKPIASAPVLVTIDANSLEDEKVLLWSLATSPKDVNVPNAAIFYGKGRWIGPLFKDIQISKENLLGVMYVIGGDCECGLDYRWVQGTMLPARWDDELHQIAVKSLGFDPENPMIKMEIGSIVGRSLGPHSYSSEPFGYQEIVIESESPDDLAIEEMNEAVTIEVNEAADTNRPTEILSTAEPNDANRKSVILSTRFWAAIMIGTVSVILVIGIAILARTRNL